MNMNLMKMEREYKKLEKENKDLWKEIEEDLNKFLMSLDKEILIEKISALIDNEIELEKYCNQ